MNNITLLQQIKNDLNIKALNNATQQVKQSSLYQSIIVYSAAARQMLFVLSENQQGINKHDLINATVEFINLFERINEDKGINKDTNNKIFDATPTEIADYIFERYLNTGFFLSTKRDHKTLYLPAPPKEAVFNKRLFIRTSFLSNSHPSMSGTGFYRIQRLDNVDNVRTLFGLPSYTVRDFLPLVNRKNDKWIKATSQFDAALPTINNQQSKQIDIIVKNKDGLLHVYPQDGSNPIIINNLNYACWALYSALNLKKYELKKRPHDNIHNFLNNMVIFELPKQLPYQEKELIKLYSWPLFLIDDSKEQNIYMVDSIIYQQLHTLIYDIAKPAIQKKTRNPKSSKSLPVIKDNALERSNNSQQQTEEELKTSLNKKKLRINKQRMYLEDKYSRLIKPFPKTKKNAINNIIPYLCALNTSSIKNIFQQSDYDFLKFDIGKSGGFPSKNHCLCHTNYVWGMVIAKDNVQQYVGIEHLNIHGILSLDNYLEIEQIVYKMRNYLFEIAKRSITKTDYWTQPYTNVISAYEKTQPDLYHFLQALRENNLPTSSEIDTKLRKLYVHNQ
ncbi:hypothetical protein LBLM1_07100 [Limosilactobacillus mucosae LM1]|uniref:Uncharacterized protein n=1 Tax=Limosilactobacillus mucosae LM1 TaxID=1130798 RepID=A0A0D4CL52_LIMMU|nr:hypothetical protein [Limosilactobacillus mucosae]AJT50789.1 hypothetical protein LBLM1_07100 [Limosilactobacillus mucosae LM1]